MSQDYKEKSRKKNSQMMKVSLVSLLIVFLFLIEMYEIINDPANLIVIGALGAFLLVSVYVEMLLIGKLTEKRAQEQEEAFDNVYRSEKASYLLIRKYFDQMEQKIENLGDISNIPYKELIAAQKALAKAQINRNKQNTNALLISNDRMMQRLTSMQNDITDILTNTKTDENTDINTNINEISSGLSEQDKSALLDGNRNVLEKQQEILRNLKELETSLRNEILESANKVASINSQQMSVQQPQMQIQENEDMIPPLDLDQDFSFDHDQKSQQVFENSSESNLDRLLQQMAVSDSLESELKPIEEESNLQSMENDLGLDSIIGEPELQPIVEEPVLEPMEEEPELQLMEEEPDLQPIVEEPELQLMEEEPDLQPIIEEPELQPIAEELDLQSVMNGSDLDSIVEEPEIQPIMNELNLQPIVNESNLEPIVEEPEIQSIVNESDLELIKEEPEIQPLMNESDLEPIKEELEIQPLMNESDLEPMKEEPEIQQVINGLDSDLGQIVKEPELQSSMNEPSLDSITKEQELQPILDESNLEAIAEKSELQPIMEAVESDTVLQNNLQLEKAPELNAISESQELKSLEEETSDNSNSSKEITPDRLAAMVANLGTNINIEPEPETVTEQLGNASFMAETLEPTVQPFVQESDLESPAPESDDEELEKIMKAMDIDDISGNSLEDLDIDKILEVPISNEKDSATSSNQVMSSEEIAALIANTELLSEPETTKNDDILDLSDPRHVMSSEEIAALIANM